MEEKFYWGSATAAHQVEGGNKNDFSAGGLDAGKACDHYRLYEKDFDLAKSLNQNAHRFSIEWSRIEPEEGRFNQAELEHYRSVIAALRSRGIEPFVTLWHFTNPIWFAQKGGWKQKHAHAYFGRYVRRVVHGLKGLVRHWIVLNEPEVYADYAYLRSRWPPKIKNLPAADRVLKHLAKGHRIAYHQIKKIQPEAEVGIATNLVGGNWLSRTILNFPALRTLRRIAPCLDFIGLNYYLKVSLLHQCFGLRRKFSKISDLGWEIYPEGLYQNLLALKKFGKPIFITENGVADAADHQRADFIKGHLAWMKKAMAAGADVRGYFHWSLMDNFEWHHGFTPRFGLLAVDYQTMERRIRPSALVYKNEIGWF